MAAHQALPEATVHDTVAALLCHPALDLVVALRRPRHGADVVRAIIESGLPAIVEKPVACDAAALAPLAEAAQMRHSWLTVPFAARYSPLWSVLGTADDLLSAHLRIVNGPPQQYAAAGCGWMLDPAESGGVRCATSASMPPTSQYSWAVGVHGASMPHRSRPARIIRRSTMTPSRCSSVTTARGWSSKRATPFP